MKRLFCLLITCSLFFGGFNIQLLAKEIEEESREEQSYIITDSLINFDDIMEIEVTEIPWDEADGTTYDVEELQNQLDDTLGTMSESYGLYWDNYASYYIYNQLEEDEKELWDALMVLCSGYLENENDFLNKTVLDTYTDFIEVSKNDFTQSKLRRLVSLFIYSNPQYYYLLNGWLCTSSENEYKIALCVYDAFQIGAERKKATKRIEEKINEWIKIVDEYTTEEEKVKTIHDLICNKVDYNYEAVNTKHENEQKEFTQSAYSVFCMDKTVCAGYMHAFTWMCNAVGIEAFGVTGSNHGLNKVNIDDNWYNIDCTTDDGGENKIMYILFLRKDEIISNAGFQPSEMWSSYLPVCTLDSGGKNDNLPEIKIQAEKPEINVTKNTDSYTIEILTSTENAKIYYTLDGTLPSEAFSKSNLYRKPIEVQEGDVLVKAIAVCNEYKDSEISEKYCDTYRNVKFVTGTEEEISPQRYEQYELITEPVLKERVGYTFEGWYTSDIIQNDTTRWDFTKDTINSNITLYAKWSANTYTISLNSTVLNTEEETKYIEYGQPYGELPQLSCSGYEFLGWFTEEGNEITADTVMATAMDHTLYAKFDPYKYKITFDPQSGIMDAVEKEVIYNKSYGQLPEPILSGGFFLGWFTQKTGGIRVCEESIVEILEDTTLYAQWEYKYKTAEPVATVSSNTVVNVGTKVILTSETRGAEIYYTTSSEIGNNLNAENGILYEEPIVIKDDVIIYTFAQKEGRADSEVVIFSYNVVDEKNHWGDITEEVRKQMEFETPDEVPLEMWTTGIHDYDYSGQAITCEQLQVFDGKVLLKEDKDYTVTYKKNINAGTAKIIIKGKGNYNGIVEKYFTIYPLDISQAVMENIEVSYNKKVRKGTTTVNYILGDDVITLKKGKDFIFSYPGTKKQEPGYDSNAFKEEGIYNAIVTGKGNYKGTASFQEIITKKYVIGETKISKISKQYYTGEEIKPEITIKRGNILLEKGVDYELKYSNNIEAGYGIVEIQGIGEYTGNKKIKFEIQGISLKKAIMEGFVTEILWGGVPAKQTVSFNCINLKNEKVYLVEGKDYIVQYQNYEKVGTAVVQYIGIGNYNGTVQKKYNILPYDISENKIYVEPIPKQIYTKNGTTPKPIITFISDHGKIILEEGKDYTLKYRNHKAVAKEGNSKIPTVIIKGKGHFKNKIEEKFFITEKEISNVSMKVGDVTYQKKSNICRPVIMLTDTNGKQLKAGIDYDKKICYLYGEDTVVSQQNQKKTFYLKRNEGEEINPKDIIPSGTKLIATVSGIHNYVGKISQDFWVVKKDISKAKITVKNQIYTGKHIEPGKEDITIKLGNVKLSKSDYGIVEYSDNIDKGYGKITITGKGNYDGIKTVTFRIKTKKLFFVF